MKLLFIGIASAVTLNVSAAVNLGAGTGSGPASSTVGVPITVVRGAADAASFASSTFTISYAQSSLSANPTFLAAAAPPWPGATGIGCTFAPGQATCGFATSGPFTNPVVPAGNYTLGTMSFPLAAAPPSPITLTAALVECTDQNGIKLPAGSCTPQNGSITVGGSTAPAAALAATATLTAGAGTVAVNVTNAGTAGGSLGLACTIPATGASAFAVTAGANRTIVGPAALGANAPAIGLSCVPQAAAVNATLSCAQTPTPAAVLPPLTSVITCPMAAGAATAITYQLPPGTAGAPAPISFPQGAGGAVGSVITAGFTVTGTNFGAGQTGTVGACTFAADPTPTAPAVSDPTAFGGFAQLTFNTANNTIAQPFQGTCTRRATAVSAIMSCPETQPSNAVNPVARVYRVTCPAATPAATVVTATTPASGSTTILAPQAFGGGVSTQVLTFGSTGVGTMNCAVTPASPGYSVTPLIVNLTIAGPNTATVTFTGTTSGTFLGTVVCTPVAPATGGPFTYNFSTTVSGTPATQIQVPALGNISLMLLIAGFLGLGVVLVGRRQA